MSEEDQALLILFYSIVFLIGLWWGSHRASRRDK
jgi:hypothetical protein